jgi:glycosyltransferase involved in cell wall biosynthesis
MAISGRPPKLGRVQVRWSAWNAASEVAQLRQIQVGLAPLPNDRWSRGKCGLRLLQYLASGIPAVASPIGTQGEITAEGAALEATTAEQWIAGITRLLDDAPAARDYVSCGRRLIRERYSAEVWARKLAQIWSNIKVTERPATE